MKKRIKKYPVGAILGAVNGALGAIQGITSLVNYNKEQKAKEEEMFNALNPNIIGAGVNPYSMYPYGGLIGGTELAELEDGEVFRTPQGDIEGVEGNTHAQGGELYNLPHGTGILGKNISEEYREKFKEIGERLKKYQDQYKRILENDKSTPIARRTSEIMLDRVKSEFDELVNQQEAEKNIEDEYGVYSKGGKIYIKPSKRGSFTSWAKSHNMGVQQAASHVMANKEKYSSAIVKKANFAKNASKWKHQDGTIIGNDPATIERRKKEYKQYTEGLRQGFLQSHNGSVSKKARKGYIEMMGQIGKLNYDYSGDVEPWDFLESVFGPEVMGANAGTKPRVYPEKERYLPVIEEYFGGGKIGKYDYNKSPWAFGMDTEPKYNAPSVQQYQINTDTTPTTPIPFANQMIERPQQPTSFLSKVGNIAGELAGLSPVIYNVGQGIFGKEEQFDYTKYLNPYENIIRDTMRDRRYDISPELESNRVSQAGYNYMLRNAGASPGQLLGGLQAGAVGRQRSDAAAYATANNMNNQYLAEQAQMDYQLGADRAAAKLQGYDINLRNRAAKRSHLSTGLSQLQQYYLVKQQMANQKRADDLRINTLPDLLSDYLFDLDKGYYFNPNRTRE